MTKSSFFMKMRCGSKRSGQPKLLYSTYFHSDVTNQELEKLYNAPLKTRSLVIFSHLEKLLILGDTQFIGRNLVEGLLELDEYEISIFNLQRTHPIAGVFSARAFPIRSPSMPATKPSNIQSFANLHES